MTEASSPHAANHHLAQAFADAESHCIKCGFCLPLCPTYRETGVEASSPRGRLDLMYAAAQGRLDLDEVERELFFCLGCLACETACPSGIRYRDMLEAGRHDVAAAAKVRSVGALLGKLGLGLLTRPRLLKLLVWKLWLYQASGLQRLVRATHLLWLLPPLARTESRMPPLLKPVAWRKPLASWLSARVQAGAEARSVVLLTGCVMDAAFGEVHGATVEVLRHNGYHTVLPEQMGCCGALQAHSGDVDTALRLAKRNIAACEVAGDTLPVLVNSAGCGALIKDYGKLLAGDPNWAERARAFSERTRDISEFLAALPLRTPEAPASPPQAQRVAYNDPCHLMHAQKVREAPRQVLGAVPGLELVPLPEADWCCGSAGSYSLTHPETALRVLERKMENIQGTGAAIVATGNPGCMMQIRLGAQRQGLKLEVRHTVELLAKAYRA